MIFCDGLGEPEGPVARPDGSWFVVEMAPARGCVSRVSADGRSVEVLARIGRPNGLAIDGRGDLWVAESQERKVLVMAPDGTVRREITGSTGPDFHFPNDLAFGPDGMLYLTDSGLPTAAFFAADGGVRDDHAAAPYDGRLYRIDPRTFVVERLDANIRFTNGLAFDARGDLFVNETMTGMIFRYRLSQGSTVRENHANVLDPALSARYRGPDGMAFDVEGRLYCTVFGQGDVTVVDPDGRVLTRIPTAGACPTNVAFATGGNRASTSPRSSAAPSRSTTSPRAGWRCTRRSATPGGGRSAGRRR